MQVFGGGYIAFNPTNTYALLNNSFPNGLNFGIVLPFWIFSWDSIDVGQIWYRTTSETSLLERAKRDVQRAFVHHNDFQPLWLLIATWEDVNYDGFYSRDDTVSIVIVYIHCH